MSSSGAPPKNSSMSGPPSLASIHVPPGINFPRISPSGLIGAIFTFLALALVGAIFRITVRLYRFRRFGLDDGLLLVSLIALSAACGIMQQLGEGLYLQIYAQLHLIPFPNNPSLLLRLHRLLQAGAVLEWVAIFAAKFSLVVFFRNLVDRIRYLELWWNIVCALVVSMGLVTIPLGFMVCTDFSESFLKTCSPSLISSREATYTYVSVALDIASDLLILSIPVALLWQVKIDIRRKLILGAMLCLSVFMIIIAIIRVAAQNLPGNVSDTTWLFFWQTMEAAIAVLMVSLTGFRSLLHGESTGLSKASFGSFGWKKSSASSHKPLYQSDHSAQSGHSYSGHDGGYNSQGGGMYWSGHNQANDSFALANVVSHNGREERGFGGPDGRKGADQGIRVTREVLQNEQRHH